MSSECSSVGDNKVECLDDEEQAINDNCNHIVRILNELNKKKREELSKNAQKPIDNTIDRMKMILISDGMSDRNSARESEKSLGVRKKEMSIPIKKKK